jgi:hypothetical protein
MRDRSDQYEEDIYTRTERDDPNDEDRRQSMEEKELNQLNECLKEIGRIVGDMESLSICKKQGD